MPLRGALRASFGPLRALFGITRALPPQGLILEHFGQSAKKQNFEQSQNLSKGTQRALLEQDWHGTSRHMGPRITPSYRPRMWSSHISDIGTSWDMGPRGGAKIGNLRIFSIFGGSGGPEGFQGVPGARGYVLTKFGLKQTHLTLVHTRFHVFLHIWGALGPGPWALVDTSCRSQLDMDLDISDLGFDRISIHKMGGCP